MPGGKLSVSQVSGELVRSEVFKRERQSLNSPTFRQQVKDITKERIRTQINNQLHRNHIDYIHSAERELILGRGLQKAAKESLTAVAIPNKHKLNVLDIKSRLRVGTERAGAGAPSKQLHEENKRYFNRLIEHISPHPEYNQTVYRILRETLKFPQVPTHIRTELSPPQKQPQLLQTRSNSYSKKSS